ncbi:MAG TPA: hypothetical protein VMU11_02970 [Verrucomicrobiae bacterium]|nr:hypothetical protein [Verrucomicrobiae bacterium]
MVAHAEFPDAASPPEDERIGRLRRYRTRDQALEALFDAFLFERLMTQSGFGARFERALVEGQVAKAAQLLFVEHDWHFRRSLHERQSALGLPDGERHTLEEAFAQLLPKLRRGKLPLAAKGRRLAAERSLYGRLTPGP